MVLMGLIKTIIILAVLIGIFAFFFPGIFMQAKNFTISTIKDIVHINSSKFLYNETGYGKDYGKILGIKNCVSDAECIKFFGIENIICHMNTTCVLEDD